ncbi:Hypothetical predicted protein [Mytilus galloprovincialis]|uniref:Uncharacterized protein n=1 Tax=Mytilus galloprovincialis TaxID=29158 RepID=A0A8B6C9A7_MYTGA|nr:Hypothetical predicted protein [Mytilus galloprovincialis]
MDDLSAENQYLLTVNTSVCFEANSACNLSVLLLEDMRLPKLPCDQQTTVVQQNFSYTSWVNNHGLNISVPLSTSMSDLLLEELGIAEYMEPSMCDRGTSPYSPSATGWNLTCPESVSLQPITDPVTCHMMESCTAVDCCVDMTQIGRSFHFFLHLDNCYKRLKVGIENYFIDIAYMNFEFDCGESIGTITTLSGPISCNVPTQCSAVSCCVYIDFLQRSFHASVDIDPCDKKFMISIDDLQLDLCYLKYQWGKKDRFKLMDMYIIDFVIDHTPSVRQFKVDMNISIWFDNTSPAYSWQIMKQNILTYSQCDFNTDFGQAGFSLTTWYTDQGLTYPQTLSQLQSSKLLQELGIGDLISDDQCQRSSSMYSPSTDGWKKDCVLDVTTETLHSSTTCVVKDTCSAVDCCTDVDFLNRPFNTFLYLDPCDLSFIIGIENFVFNASLTSDPNFEFGVEKQFNLKGVVRLTYKIEDLSVERQYRVSLRVRICFEDTTPLNCMIEFNVFDDSLVPKKQCSWNAGFSDPDFSLSSFLSPDYTVGDTLPDAKVTEVLNALGIVSYVESSPCDILSDTYSPNYNGWRKDCDVDVTFPSPPSIPSSAMCSLHSSCTSVDCCVKIDFLQHGFRASLDLDPCKHVLTFTIERLQERISLNGYMWGTQETRTLMNVVKIVFTITEQPLQYEIDLDISICFEFGGACYFTMTVFKDTILPKQFCTNGTTFMDSEFSLSQFLSDQGQAMVSPLPSGISTTLLSTLEITEFLQGTPCSHSVYPYTLTNGRFNNECDEFADSVTLPSSVSCSIGAFSSGCSNILCCTQVDFVSRGIENNIFVDPCNYELTIRIETMTVTISLLDYQWGTEKTFSLQGGIRLNFTLNDLTNENVFMVKFSIHLCLETSDPDNCVVDLPIMDNVKLPKGTCDWKKGFNINRFSILGWLGETYENKDTLDPYVVNELMRDLQLIDYLMEPQCDVSTAPYTPVNGQGWNISPGCTTAPTLSTLTSEEVTCNLGDSCTSIKCCVTSVKLGRTFTIDLDLDVCNQTFMVGVDRLTRTVALASFVFSQEDVFSFDGLINVRYKIDDFQSDNQYMISLDIDVCYHYSQACTVQLQILHDARLTKETCTVDSGYAIPNFSLASWLTSQGISPSISVIPSYIVDLLTEDLGINGHLKEPSCVKSSSGWDTSACPETVSLTTLPSYTSCQLPSYCTGVQCCTEIGILGRSWQTFVLVDTCKYRVSIGIENQMVNITLFEFVQGTWATVTLGNVLRLG